MTIDEAIEILTHLKAATNSASRQDCDKAYQLGIEALREVKMARFGGPTLECELLPGETES